MYIQKTIKIWELFKESWICEILVSLIVFRREFYAQNPAPRAPSTEKIDQSHFQRRIKIENIVLPWLNDLKVNLAQMGFQHLIMLIVIAFVWILILVDILIKRNFLTAKVLIFPDVWMLWLAFLWLKTYKKQKKRPWSYKNEWFYSNFIITKDEKIVNEAEVWKPYCIFLTLFQCHNWHYTEDFIYIDLHTHPIE